MVHIDDLLDDQDAVPDSPHQKYCLRSRITPYICSTPDDFVEEREHLVKHVFPRLHELCVHRGGKVG